VFQSGPRQTRWKQKPRTIGMVRGGVKVVDLYCWCEAYEEIHYIIMSLSTLSNMHTLEPQSWESRLKKLISIWQVNALFNSTAEVEIINMEVNIYSTRWKIRDLVFFFNQLLGHIYLVPGGDWATFNFFQIIIILIISLKVHLTVLHL